MLLVLCLVQVVDSFIGSGLMLYKGTGEAASADTVATTEFRNVLAEVIEECLPQQRLIVASIELCW
jgi:hypothetical protein